MADMKKNTSLGSFYGSNETYFTKKMCTQTAPWTHILKAGKYSHHGCSSFFERKKNDDWCVEFLWNDK